MLHAETVHQLFPEYGLGLKLAVVVVLPDGRELPVSLRRGSAKGSLTCGAGWAAVRAAADLAPGRMFGALSMAW